MNLRERYDAHLEKFLAENGRKALCYTAFPELVDMRVNGTEEIEAITALQPPIMKTTHVFLYDAKDRKEASSAVEALFRGANLYGSYTLFFVPDAEEGDLQVLEKNRRQYERFAFNCFAANEED